SLYHPDNSSLHTLKPYYEVSKKGSDTVDDAYKSFARQETKVGDIVKIKHRELVTNGNFVGVFTHNVWSTPTTGFINDEAFFEITKEGVFNPLHINQLSSKEIHIKNGTTEEEITQKLQESIDFRGYKNITIERFKDNLPDTTKDGKQELD
ncbi:hypothetical protein COK29_30630, partial [Bacillus cereus]|uniref:hypothetical protein n=1 Tax=Bacillus cereus TaxID=1396 RepID=UPI000C009A02